MAALAVLAAALAPSISHALGSMGGASWVEVCTSIGAQWVSADADAGDESPAPSGVHWLEHCPYCSLHANVVAMPATPAVIVPALLPDHGRPLTFLAAAPRTRHAWASAQPRAPPLFS